MTVHKRKVKLTVVEALQQDQDLMKALIPEMLHKILEAEKT